MNAGKCRTTATLNRIESLSRCGTSNTEHRTSNIEWIRQPAVTSAFDVRGSMFDVDFGFLGRAFRAAFPRDSAQFIFI